MFDPLEPALSAPLGEIIEQPLLEEVCRNYRDLFGIPIRVFDIKGALIAETTGPEPICQYLNQFDNSKKICTKTRLEVKRAELGAEIQDATDVDCVCGLRYSMFPIVFRNETVGKLTFGPYLPTELNDIPEAVYSLDSGMDKGSIQEKLKSAPDASQTTVQRAGSAIKSVIDVILFSASKTHITSQMHIAAVRESYKELMEKNRRLEEMHEKMKEFEQLKANFLATVSHELRTPLTSIIGYSDMLFEGIAGELGEEQRQFVETIRVKGEELMNLISSILDFTEIDTGHLDLQKTQIDTTDLIKSAIADHNEFAERRKIKLTIDLPEDLPEILVDPSKIKIAISHLAENAIKFSRPNGMVKVSARVTPAENGDISNEGIGFVLMSSNELVEISIEDYGIGIAEGDVDNVFTPFTQLDNSSTREYGGAGLGLALVKHYTEAHGGNVKLQSRLNEGSVFSIRIPIGEQD